MYYAFIEEAWNPPQFSQTLSKRKRSEPKFQTPRPEPEPVIEPEPKPEPKPRKSRQEILSLPAFAQYFESLYAQYGFKNIMDLLPKTFRLEAREHFRDEASSGSSWSSSINTGTITTILLSGVLVLIFYDALSKLFRM